MRKQTPILLAAVVVGFIATFSTAGTETLQFEDLMKFRKIEGALIAKDGRWIGYTLKPDRGESEAIVRAVDGDRIYRVERGGAPKISGDSNWFAAPILPTQQERDEAIAAKKKPKDGPRSGLSLLSLVDGEERRVEEVKSFSFSDDGRWIVWLHHKAKDEDKEKEADESGDEGDGEEGEEEEADDKDRPLGTKLILIDLANSQEMTIEHVVAYSFDEPSRFLAYTVAAPWGKGNGIFVRELAAPDRAPISLATEEFGRYTELSWAEKSSRLAFVASVDDDLHDPGPATVWSWLGKVDQSPSIVAASEKAPDGWRIPSKNKLTWSRDGERLFFGYGWIDPAVEEIRLNKKEEKRAKKEKEKSKDNGEEKEAAVDESAYDAYDIDALLDKRGVDVWHGEDPFIIPHQKKRWDKDEKNRLYLAVAHIDTGKVVRLAGRDLPDVAAANNSRAVLAESDLGYRRRVTWDGRYADVYYVSLKDGKRQRIAKEMRWPTTSLSPDGRYVAYWRDGHWHLFDGDTGESRNLTGSLKVPFANEDDDYPQPDPGYGVADWVEGDRAVLIYDKYDLWRFPVDGGAPLNLTGGQGRTQLRQFRLVDLDKKRDSVRNDERLLLRGYHDKKKNDGYWSVQANRAKLSRLLEEDARFRVIAKAEEADHLLYTRETYNEFPDLWVGDLEFGGRKLSNANPQIERFAWGTPELVEWSSADGVPLQGILIRPENYEPGKRYPVLVYYYRFFTQNLYRFNEPVINHRPSFPIYASDGYAVFLPDIRFEIGRPGLSAVKALVPGVQKLVDMGVADPDAIGLHGHSWSGYQTAYVVTQTHKFAAAVAGAPVSNMTSAYSGIRLGSGLARQFQYEQSQSRIGESMDAGLPLYIENSPVFFARRIQTPLLIQFGDVDEAVPWQQGIELYLAMRRLDKKVVFLQYRDEPHHLKKYPNKLDYSIKMKQYFDHYLKGEPAAEWITDGVPYRGE